MSGIKDVVTETLIKRNLHMSILKHLAIEAVKIRFQMGYFYHGMCLMAGAFGC